MPSSGLLSASDIRRVPTAGNLSRSKVKREYQSAEGGTFAELRKAASSEAVTFQQLRDRCSSLLRSTEGVRACRRNEEAQAVLCAALTKAIDDEDWRELWILLAQMQRWLEVMDVPAANHVWPFWLQQSDEARAGCSRGTALCIDQSEEIDVDTENEIGADSPVVKAEHTTQECESELATQSAAAASTASSELPPSAVASTFSPDVPQPTRRRRMAAPSVPQLCDFPVGCEVLTPRKDGETLYVTYCKVLSHKHGQLQVDIPGEKSFTLSLDYLRRTSEKNGMPMRKELAPVQPVAHLPSHAHTSALVATAPAAPSEDAPSGTCRKRKAVDQATDQAMDEAADRATDHAWNSTTIVVDKTADSPPADEDDVEFVGEAARNQLVDYPHARENCMRHSFAPGKENLRCDNCYCCALWPEARTLAAWLGATVAAVYLDLPAMALSACLQMSAMRRPTTARHGQSTAMHDIPTCVGNESDVNGRSGVQQFWKPLRSTTRAKLRKGR